MAEWHDQLPEEMRGNETLATITDVPALAQSYLDAQQHIGGSLRIPSDDAGEEDWASFNSKLADKVPTLANIPSDPDAAKAFFLSKLGLPEDGAGYTSEGLDEGFREFAHKNGFTNDQVAALIAKVNEDNTNAQTLAEEAGVGAINALKAEWGHAYDQKLAEANKAIGAFGGDEGMAFAKDSGLIQNPAFLKMMSAAGANLGEEPAGGVPASTNLVPTPEEAKLQISEIRNNKDHVWHKGNREALAWMDKLHQYAFPS